ncbi:MAG: RagB/SusD family nutrient uptake outer membrane protein [Bacteroidales bacterium]|nr:RagB/SusD family nutrient uptake outer membrane protein [Bacteroidales bacterium]
MKYLKTKYKIVIVSFFILLPVFSCSDWLDLTPPDGLVKEEFWKTKEDVKTMLMGAYQRFATLDEKLFLFGELRADMIIDDNNTNWNQRQIMLGNIYPTNSMCDWKDFYLVISYCNLVLKYGPVILEIDPTFTDYQQKGYEAEAIYLRSLAYFYLVRIFKEVPLVLEPSEDDDADFYLAKSSDTTILNFIKNDLKAAKLFVTDEYKSLEENKGRATKAAILSLLADISLWNFEYNNVIAYIDEIETMDFLLLPAGKWFENFNPGNSPSSIFEFQFNSSLEQYNDLYSYTYFNNKRFKASSKALELLSQDSEGGDLYRGKASIREIDGSIWKYCGYSPDGRTFRPSDEQYDANWIVYRYADLMLMKAEALSQLARFDEAQQILNTIRSRALANPITVPYTEEAFEDAIMQERAIELAFEGKRWFDLLRLGRRNNYKRKNDLIRIIIENVPSTQRLVLASKLTDPYGWYLPIQENEIERNASLEQNPYYESYTNE